MNPEADILSFDVKEDVGQIIPDLSAVPTQILVYYSKGDITHLTPIMTFTKGASVYPDPTEPQDFSRSVIYTVTSHNGKNTRVHKITFTKVSLSGYGFDNWVSDSRKHFVTPIEYDGENEIPFWDTSNRGAAIYATHQNSDEYPVHYTTQPGEVIKGGKAAVLETQQGPGNILGQQFIPIVAGSLFSGTFDPKDAMKDPLLCTKFGQPYTEIPQRMVGYYKYKAGENGYTEPNGNINLNRKDKCAIYAVFYKTDENLMTLDGTNILNHQNIVSIAMMPDDMLYQSKGDGMVSFDIPFEYQNGYTSEKIDFETNKYKLAVVFSSSFYGDHYEGSVGSRLVVDEVNIINENR